MEKPKDLIIIGSPRGKGSNSLFLAQIFIRGFKTINNEAPHTIFLSHIKEINTHLEVFKNAKRILWFFPLYTDAMPALVKNFMENLSKNDFSDKQMGFFIISGFPEARHSMYVERYFINLTKKYNAQLIGSVIKGGMEGVSMQPKWLTRKVRKQVKRLGYNFAQTGKLDPAISKKMRKMVDLPKIAIFMITIMKKLGLMNKYWNKNLKRNNAFQQRFDKPYGSLINYNNLTAE